MIVQDERLARGWPNFITQPLEIALGGRNGDLSGILGDWSTAIPTSKSVKRTINDLAHSEP
jgi:hypothetical protein